MTQEHNPVIKILVACHKDDPAIRQDSIYTPIQVGKELHQDIDLGFLTDNTGDNISIKNASYCELTALYWAWKNLKDVDYIGLAHYRRYFDFSSKKYCEVVTTDDTSYISDGDVKTILKLLKKYDVITPRPNIFPYSVATDYAIAHNSEDMRCVQQIIKKDFAEYYGAFIDTLHRSNFLSPYNMFITRWDIFDEYCRFLFGVLAEMEKVTHTEYYNPYQKRIYGFLAERLWNVFLTHKIALGIRIKYEPVRFITEEISRYPVMRYIINKIRHNISFRLSRSRDRLRD
ncbi:MAG: DUF4422 domain-containing protein [Duncaniella sp.]|nr:DUF4422 domain-containing protein [Duncaniella sp.]